MNSHKAENEIIPIDTLSKQREADLLAEEVVDKPGDLKNEWLSLNRYASVPVHYAGSFTEEDAARLACAMKELGCSECLGVATEGLDNTVLYYRVPATTKGLLSFREETGHFYFLLIPKNLSFAVLCTGSDRDYYIVAGAKEFVENALGKSIKAARKKFLNIANDAAKNPRLPENWRLSLLDTAKRYEQFNG
jgi:hypothetical protein